MTLDYLCSRFVYRDNASDYPLNTESKLIFPQPCTCYKQLLDEVFVISGIIKVEVSVISRSPRLRLITLTNCFIIQTHYRSDQPDIAVREHDIALGNHARATYRLFTNL